MQRERMVLGLGPNSKRYDGSQDDVIIWDDSDDVKQTTEFYHELPVLGWDCTQMYARLKTGEYVIGDAHGSMCGTVVSKDDDVDPDLKAKLYEEKASIFRVLAKFPSRYA